MVSNPPLQPGKRKPPWGPCTCLWKPAYWGHQIVMWDPWCTAKHYIDADAKRLADR